MAVSAVPMESVRVEKSDTCGRKLVATSRFPPGKCILEELPFAYTLCDTKRGLYCDFCLKQCSTLKKCARCKCVSYCNKSCQTGDWTICHKQDCKTLERIHPGVPGDFVQLLSKIIRKQRTSAPCTQDDEDCFPTSVDQLESHLSDIVHGPDQISVSPELFFEEDVLAEPSSVLNMYGTITCNSFLILDNDLKGIASGIYLRASMLNHSCDPNCVWVFDGRKIQIMTVKDVKEGEECTVSYVDSIHPAKERQTQLKKRYHFTCKCVKCVEEINSLGPDDGLDKELQDRLKKSLEKIEDSVESQDWAKVLQLCAPYLKQMDSSSSLPANHHLLVKVKSSAFEAYIQFKEWEKAAEIGKLNIEPYRYHYGLYNPGLGMHLLSMGKVLRNLKRIPEARKYLTEAMSVFEVTHGPHHSLMKTKSMKYLLLLSRSHESHPIWLINERISL